MPLVKQLKEKIDRSEALVVVVGAGYVGLPLAVEIGHAGLRAVCVDVSEEKCRLINAGTSYIPDVPTEQLAPLVQKGLLRATTDFDILREADAVSICVPTPLSKTKDPDMSMVLDVADKLQSRLKLGALVVLESTTYPGTTREIFLPRLSSNNRTPGKDFFLVFSPERVDPGNPKYNTKNTPKIIGGTTPSCSEVAKHLYSRFIDTVVSVTSTDAAEMVKLLENTFRAVNIGLVNEVAIMCRKLDIDTWEVINAAATKPFGFMPFFPGPGLGGHCLVGSETVRVRGRGLDTILSLESLFLFAQIDSRIRKVDEHLEVIEPTGLETLSLDPETGKSDWKPISHLFRRVYQGKMAKVELSGNITLQTTDRHPMLVIENDKVVERFSCDVKPGDRVPQFNDELPKRTERTLHNPYLLSVVPFSVEVQRNPENGWRECNTLEVTGVTLSEGTHKVYSLEVPGTHTFATTGGVFVHNCIPVDPLYLSWKLKTLKYNARFIELADAVNSSMPLFVVQQAQDILNDASKSLKGSKIMLLGMAYKKDIDDVRESPALDVFELLHQKGAHVDYHDPYIPKVRMPEGDVFSTPLPEGAGAYDLVIITTDHKVFDYARLLRGVSQVFDTRNALASFSRDGLSVHKL